MLFFSGRRRAIWVEAAVGAALLFGITHYWHAHSASRGPANQSETGVPTAAVSLGNITETVRITGTIGALRSATVLAPRIQGNRSGVNRGGSGGVANNAGVMSGGMDFNLVLLRLAKPGALVKAGEIVAEFDPQNQVQRVDDYKDAVVQLEGSIRKMAATLASNKEAHDQSVRAAKAGWDKSIQDLRQSTVVDAIDAELLKVAAEENEATYKQLVYESSLVDEQQISQIRLSELNHDQADLELKRAEANVPKMVIRAPMDGVVVMATIVRNGELGQVREGDQVNPGQPFMYIIDPNAMVLDAFLNQVDAERLRLGAKALVHVDSYSDCEMPGSVT
ncbi:MAG: HlyD family efflux transporter periplasmic adaptor subunit [Acidobacteriia bacterium]|nr:HlyD family efflux transporter periplasmic adaptor subunit [Terriglobia bacterium]